MAKKMRHLDDTEKKIVNKNLIFLAEEMEYKEKVELAKIQLTLDTAEIEVKKQIQETEYKKKAKVAEIEELKTSINILKKQLREGVEVKQIDTKEEQTND